MTDRRSGRSHRRREVSIGEVLFCLAGLITATASGFAAYRAIGPYGDGPINVGIYRETDANTGAPLLYRQVREPGGAVVRYLFDDGSRKLTEIRRTLPNGAEELAYRPGGVTKVGFSLRRNGVVDAWQYRDAKGQLERIEVSRQQDGVVDRWEYYKDGQITRVELDDNGDGRVDRWQTYEGGILMEESRDGDGDGKPDNAR